MPGYVTKLHCLSTRLTTPCLDYCVIYYSVVVVMQKHRAYIIHRIYLICISTYSLITRCNASVILLEMDRILRPGGRAYICDKKETIEEIKEITDAMGWRSTIRDTAEGAYASRKVLMCDKPMVR